MVFKLNKGRKEATLAGVAHSVEHCPMSREVISSISGRLDSPVGGDGCFPLSKRNKNIFYKRKKKKACLIMKEGRPSKRHEAGKPLAYLSSLKKTVYLWIGSKTIPIT